MPAEPTATGRPQADEECVSRGAAVACLVAVAVVGLGLRLRGLDFLLPHSPARDGRIAFTQVELMRAHDPHPEAHPWNAYYPHLVSKIVAALPAPAPAPVTVAVAPGGDPADPAQYLAAAAAPYLQIRLVTVALSLLIVPGIYLLARYFLGRGGSLLATALGATSLLHFSFSQQERPHAVVTSFVLLAVLAAVRLRRRPQPAAYLLAGVAAALAVGSLHNGAAALPALLVAHLARRRKPGGRDGWWLVAALGVVAVAVRWLYPFEFAPAPAAAEAAGAGLEFSGHHIPPGSFDGAGFAALFGSLASYDPVLSLAAGVGLVTGVRRLVRGLADDTRRDLLVILACALPYALVLGMYRNTAARFGLPLVPFLAVLGAGGATAVFRAFARGGELRYRCRLGAAAAVLLLALPSWANLRLGAVRSRPDTYTRAATWIREHVDREREDVVLLLSWYQDLPLLEQRRALEANAAWPWTSPWFDYQRQLPAGASERGWALRMPLLADRQLGQLAVEPWEYLRALDARWVVVERAAPSPRSKPLRVAQRTLEENARRVARFSPFADPEQTSGLGYNRFQTHLARPMVGDVLRAECMGPVLEIYRIE